LCGFSGPVPWKNRRGCWLAFFGVSSASHWNAISAMDCLVGFLYKILLSFFPNGMLMLLLHLSRGGVGGLTLASALSKSPDIRLPMSTRPHLNFIEICLLSFRPGQDRGELGDTQCIRHLQCHIKSLIVPTAGHGDNVHARFGWFFFFDWCNVTSFASRWYDGVSPRRVP
jgi:hypothetical protein